MARKDKDNEDSQLHMNPDDVRGPDGEELEWPEPQEDDGEEKGESLANDGTPGAIYEGDEEVGYEGQR